MRSRLGSWVGAALLSVVVGCDGGATTPTPPGPWCGSREGQACACDAGSGSARCALTDGAWALTCVCGATTDGALDARDE